MALPNTSGTVIATGYNCYVRFGTNAADAATNGPIALVASFQATEDFQVQDAVCLGNLGPVDIAPQGYTCSITMDGFLPAKGVLGGTLTAPPDSSKNAVADMVKNQTRAKFMEVGVSEKIAYVDFYNKKETKVLASFEGVIVTSYGITAEANGYVRNNVQMRALAMTRAS